MSVVLHDYWRSSASYRVRIALALKRVAYTRIDVPLLKDAQRAPANMAVNAQGFVPTLEIDGQVLTQSLAIIDYLDATRPDPPLLPRDPGARSAVLARALVIAADIHPINNLRVLRYLKDELGAGQAARDAWYRHWMAQGLAALEAMCVGRGGPFLGGAAPDLADICLIPQLYNARRLDLPLDDYPALLAADSAAAAHPAFIAAHPESVQTHA